MGRWTPSSVLLHIFPFWGPGQKGKSYPALLHGIVVQKCSLPPTHFHGKILCPTELGSPMWLPLAKRLLVIGMKQQRLESVHESHQKHLPWVILLIPQKRVKTIGARWVRDATLPSPPFPLKSSHAEQVWVEEVESLHQKETWDLIFYLQK